MLTVFENHQVLNLLKNHEFATEFFIVSELHITEGASLTATVAHTAHAMCPRCRKYEPIVTDDLCQRCLYYSPKLGL